MPSEGNTLADIISAEIREKGPMRFDRYMELCLYHPELGYYMRPEERTGREGDYFTAPHVTALFGRILFLWIRDCLKRLPSWDPAVVTLSMLSSGREPASSHPLPAADSAGRGEKKIPCRANMSAYHLVELGPGNGLLMEQVLTAWVESLPGTRPEERAAFHLDVTLVEESAARRDEMREKRFGDMGRRLRDRLPPEWREDFTVGVDLAAPPAWLKGSRPGRGIILANEFFDALPLRIIRRVEGSLREVFVELVDGSFRETLLPFIADSADPAAARSAESLPEGCSLEFAPAARVHLAAAARRLSHGFFLILDYGDTAEALAVPWRAGDTLRCYRDHQVDGDPFRDPGEKDVTASVNFSLLMEWAREAGFAVDSFTTFSSFLVRGGLIEALMEENAHLEDWRKVKTLLDVEGGMGEAFKVLVLRKGMVLLREQHGERA